MFAQRNKQKKWDRNFPKIQTNKQIEIMRMMTTKEFNKCQMIGCHSLRTEEKKN